MTLHLQLDRTRAIALLDEALHRAAVELPVSGEGVLNLLLAQSAAPTEGGTYISAGEVGTVLTWYRESGRTSSNFAARLAEKEQPAPEDDESESAPALNDDSLEGILSDYDLNAR